MSMASCCEGSIMWGGEVERSEIRYSCLMRKRLQELQADNKSNSRLSQYLELACCTFNSWSRFGDRVSSRVNK